MILEHLDRERLWALADRVGRVAQGEHDVTRPRGRSPHHDLLTEPRREHLGHQPGEGFELGDLGHHAELIRNDKRREARLSHGHAGDRGRRGRRRPVLDEGSGEREEEGKHGVILGPIRPGDDPRPLRGPIRETRPRGSARMEGTRCRDFSGARRSLQTRQSGPWDSTASPG